MRHSTRRRLKRALRNQASLRGRRDERRGRAAASMMVALRSVDGKRELHDDRSGVKQQHRSKQRVSPPPRSSEPNLKRNSEQAGGGSKSSCVPHARTPEAPPPVVVALYSRPDGLPISLFYADLIALGMSSSLSLALARSFAHHRVMARPRCALSRNFAVGQKT